MRTGREAEARELRKQVRAVVGRLARAFAAELAAELERLLLGVDTVRPTPHEKARRRRDDRALEDVSSRVLAFVANATGPVAIRELSAALELDRRELAHPLSLLVSEGKLARTGERRGARYRAVLRASDTMAPRDSAKVASRRRPRAR